MRCRITNRQYDSQLIVTRMVHSIRRHYQLVSKQVARRIRPGTRQRVHVDARVRTTSPPIRGPKCAIDWPRGQWICHNSSPFEFARAHASLLQEQFDDPKASPGPTAAARSRGAARLPPPRPRDPKARPREARDRGTTSPALPQPVPRRLVAL